jgi:O-antigen/teichoic acid export membrane protein
MNDDAVSSAAQTPSRNLGSTRSVLQSAIARALSFVPIALATFGTSRLILEHYGIPALDSFALVTSLILLIPLQDLGMGAAVTSAFAERGPRDDHSIAVMLTAMRVLSLSSLALATASVVVTVLGAWPTLLGPASGPNAYVGAAVCIYALTFLPGLGQRMLLGIERNHMVVIIQTLWNPLMLVGVGIFAVTGVGPAWIVLVPSVAVLLVSLLTFWYAVRATAFPATEVLARIPFRSRFPGGSVWAISGPMVVLTLCVPVILQSDRIVLSHVSTKQVLANYTITLQIFAPVAALVAAAALPLWPMWIRARARGEQGPSVGKVAAVFCGATAAVCALLVLIADPLGHVIGGDPIHLGVALPGAAGLAITMQAVALPVGMALRDPQGLRFVAVCTAIALPTNIALAVALAELEGGPGPLVATSLVTLFVQILPAAWFLRRRNRAASAGEPAVHDQDVAGEVVVGGIGQEQHGTSDVGGLAEPTDRGAAHDLA